MQRLASVLRSVSVLIHPVYVTLLLKLLAATDYHCVASTRDRRQHLALASALVSAVVSSVIIYPWKLHSCSTVVRAAAHLWLFASIDVLNIARVLQVRTVTGWLVTWVAIVVALRHGAGLNVIVCTDVLVIATTIVDAHVVAAMHTLIVNTILISWHIVIMAAATTSINVSHASDWVSLLVLLVFVPALDQFLFRLLQAEWSHQALSIT